MKMILLVISLALLGGCEHFKAHRSAYWFVGGVAVGAYVASQDDGPAADPITSPCFVWVPPGIMEPRLC